MIECFKFGFVIFEEYYGKNVNDGGLLLINNDRYFCCLCNECLVVILCFDCNLDMYCFIICWDFDKEIY